MSRRQAFIAKAAALILAIYVVGLVVIPYLLKGRL